MKNILITGAHGQVGKELSQLATAKGFNVIAASRADLDITQAQEVDAFISQSNAELVINAAAHTAVDKAESEQDLAVAINRDGAMNIAQACKKLKIPLLHISTDYVFDGSKAEPYNENDAVSYTELKFGDNDFYAKVWVEGFDRGAVLLWWAYQEVPGERQFSQPRPEGQQPREFVSDEEVQR